MPPKQPEIIKSIILLVFTALIVSMIFLDLIFSKPIDKTQLYLLTGIVASGIGIGIKIDRFFRK